MNVPSRCRLRCLVRLGKSALSGQVDVSLFGMTTTLALVAESPAMKDDRIFCNNHGGFMKDMSSFGKFAIGSAAFALSLIHI